MKAILRFISTLGALLLATQTIAAELPALGALQKKARAHVDILQSKEKTTVYYFAADETREPCKDHGFLCQVEDGSQQWVQGTYSLIVVRNDKPISAVEVGGQNYREGNNQEKIKEFEGKIALLNPNGTKDYLIVVPSVGAGAMNFYQEFYRLNPDGTLKKSKLFLSDGTPWESFANFEGKQNKDGTITSSEPFYRESEETIAKLPGKLDEHGFLNLNFTYRDGNFYADLPKK